MILHKQGVIRPKTPQCNMSAIMGPLLRLFEANLGEYITLLLVVTLRCLTHQKNDDVTLLIIKAMFSLTVVEAANRNRGNVNK